MAMLSMRKAVFMDCPSTIAVVMGGRRMVAMLLPEAQTQPFLARVFDVSAGTIEGLVGDSEYRDFPI